MSKKFFVAKLSTGKIKNKIFCTHRCDTSCKTYRENNFACGSTLDKNLNIKLYGKEKEGEEDDKEKGREAQDAPIVRFPSWKRNNPDEMSGLFLALIVKTRKATPCGFLPMAGAVGKSQRKEI